LRIGDYLMIERFGAYTICGASEFNGIDMVNVKIIWDDD